MALCEFIRGIVLLETGEGSPTVLGGATVQLTVGAGVTTTVLAETRSDIQGRFSFDLVDGPGRGHGGSLRVVQKGVLLACHGDVRWSDTDGSRNHVICAKAPTICTPPEEFTPEIEPPVGQSGTPSVWGQVRHVGNTPVAGATVELWGLTTLALDSTATGTCFTNPSGYYGFWGTLPADFVVKAKDGVGSLLAISPAAYGPDLPVRIDLVTCDNRYRVACEFARIDAAIHDVVSSPDPSGWTVETVAILSGRTGWAVDRITFWILANRIAALLPAGGPTRLVEQLYGLLREGFPRTKDGILTRTSASVTRTLTRAARQNIISAAAASTGNSPVVYLDVARQAVLASNRDDAIGAILRTSGILNDNQVNSFVALYTSFHGTDTEFWETVPTLSYFDDPSAVEAKRLIALGNLALCWAPAVAQILTIVGSGPASSVATITHTQWMTLAHATSPLPDGLQGETPSDQADDLARILEEHASLAFPSAVTMSRLVAGTSTLGGAQSWFADNPNFDLVHDRVEVVDSSADAPTRTAVRQVQRLYRIAPATTRAESIAVLFDAGIGSARQVAALGGTRFQASFGASLGADAALETFQKARSLSAMATMFIAQAHPNLGAGAMRFLPEYTETEDGYVDLATANPDLATLFGSLSACACVECRSIVGPVAYFADLLHWLSDKPLADGSGNTALDFLIGSTDGPALDGRRPDLGTLHLTCDNALRALPYIDLTLEILEAAAVGDLPSSHDTTADGDELLAAPEYPEADAYTTLAAATNSVSLPFLQPAAEMRAFLGFLGVDRTDLMRAFQTGTPTDADIAQEELRTSTTGWSAITTVTGDNTAENTYWPESIAAEVPSLGLTTFRRAAEVQFGDVLDLLHSRFINPRVDPADATTATTELHYSDLTDLDTYVLQPVGVGNLNYQHIGPLRQLVRLQRMTGWSFLDTDKVLAGLGLTSTTLNDAALTDLGNIHRLARWTGLGPVEIAAWRADVPLDVWNDRASRETPVLSFYAATILSPSLFDATARTSGAWSVTVGGSAAELTGAGSATLGSETAMVQAVLGVDTGTLAQLLTTTSLTTSSALSLANVSALYRWVSLSRAAGLNAADATYLAMLSAIDPTATYADAIDFLTEVAEVVGAGWSIDVLRYVVKHEATERVAPTDDWIQETLGKLRDALAAAYSGLTKASTDAAMIDIVVKVLAESFGIDRAIIDEWRTNAETTAWTHLPWASSEGGTTEDYEFAAATSVVLEVTNLSLRAGTTVLIPASTATIKGTIDGTLVGPVTLTADLMASLVASAATTSSAVIGVDLELPAGTGFSVPAGSTTATLPTLTTMAYPAGSTTTSASVVPPTSFDVTLRADLMVTWDGTSYIFVAGMIVTIEMTPSGNTIEVDAKTTVDVASGTFTVPSSFPIADLLVRFLRMAFWNAHSSDATNPWSDLTRDDFGFDFTAIDLLAKAVLIVRTLGIDADERAFWYDASSAWSLPAIGDVSTDSSGIPYSKLKNLVDLFALRKRIPGTAPTYAELLNAIADGTGDTDPDHADDWAFPGMLADRTSWTEDDLRTLVTRFTPYASSPITDLVGAGPLKTLFDQIDIVRRVGGGANTVIGWAVVPDALTATLSAQAVAAARSRYDDPARWAAIAHPIRDGLRKTQRDALVSYLLPMVNVTRTAAGLNPVRDADGLYQYYYIDVSMNPEMLTSRIVQGYCTVQLFVHRCMFGIETTTDTGGNVVPLVDFTDDDRRMWEWMRTYRVWQAARKVFLYPENWILPELRDDKTPFYKQFEQELAQGDLVADRVEQGMLDYLDRVHDVASLYVLAYYVQKETVDDEVIDKIHVIARSRGTPTTYWYRRREDSTFWTPWEKVTEATIRRTLLIAYWDQMEATGTVASMPTKEARDAEVKQYNLAELRNQLPDATVFRVNTEAVYSYVQEQEGK